MKYAKSRTVSPWLLLAVVVMYGVLAWGNIRFVFPFVDTFLSSSGFSQLIGAWLPHGIALMVCVGLLMLYVGKMNLADLGLRRRDFLLALPIAIGFLVVVNLYVYLDSSRSTDAWSFNSRLQKTGLLAILAEVVMTQVLGNAMLEEIVFRGLLFQQVFRFCRDTRKLRGKRGISMGVSALIATVVSVSVFVAMHIPIRLHNGLVGDELIANLVRVAIWGTVFTMLYFSSRNLWLVILIHALTNRELLVVEPVGSYRGFELLLCVLIVFGCAVWSLVNTQRNRPVLPAP